MKKLFALMLALALCAALVSASAGSVISSLGHPLLKTVSVPSARGIRNSSFSSRSVRLRQDSTSRIPSGSGTVPVRTT